MSRRRRESAGINLFPFMSVLACVIGTLTLLISGLALGEIGSSYVAEIDLQKALKAVRENIEERLREVDRAQAEVATGEARLDLLEEALKELAALRVLRAEGEAKRGRIRDTELRRDALAADRASLEQEIEHLQSRVRELEAELERQRKSLEAAEQTVILRPSGSGTDLSAEFIECVETGLILGPDRPERHRQFVRLVEIRGNEGLKRRFERASDSGGRTLIFLVRQGGVAAYQQARLLALQAGVPCGATPVPTQKPLDFSLFSGDR